MQVAFFMTVRRQPSPPPQPESRIFRMSFLKLIRRRILIDKWRSLLCRAGSGADHWSMPTAMPSGLLQLHRATNRRRTRVLETEERQMPRDTAAEHGRHLDRCLGPVEDDFRGLCRLGGALRTGGGHCSRDSKGRSPSLQIYDPVTRPIGPSEESKVVGKRPRYRSSTPSGHGLFSSFLPNAPRLRGCPSAASARQEAFSPSIAWKRAPNTQ